MGLIAWPIATVRERKTYKMIYFISLQFMIRNSSIIMKITSINKIEKSLEMMLRGRRILWMIGWLCQNWHISEPL